MLGSAPPLPSALTALVALLGAVTAVIAAQTLLTYVERRERAERPVTLAPRFAALMALIVILAELVLLWNKPLTAPAIERAVWVAALAVIFVVDLRSHFILDVFTAPMAVAVLGAALTVGSPPIALALVGGAIGLAFYGAFYGLGLLMFRRPALGLGDVKLATLLGLMLGPDYIVTAVFIGAILGGIGSLALLSVRRAKLTDAPAYGTYITLGGFVALLGAAGWFR